MQWFLVVYYAITVSVTGYTGGDNPIPTHYSNGGGLATIPMNSEIACQQAASDYMGINQVKHGEGNRKAWCIASTGRIITYGIE